MTQLENNYTYIYLSAKEQTHVKQWRTQDLPMGGEKLEKF